MYLFLSICSLAAKVRVATYENEQHGGLDVTRRARRLRALLRSTHHLYRKAIWRTWIEANPLLVLDEAVSKCRDLGITAHVVQGELAGPSNPRPWTPAVARRVRSKFQATLTASIQRRELYCPKERIRHKLARWKFQGMPRKLADAALRHLAQLATMAPPRVCAAVLSTMWNRWITARRFQREGSCVLGCSTSAQDSIEHYACCPIVRGCAATMLRIELRPPPHAIADFMLVSTPPAAVEPKSAMLRMALLVYAVYTSTNDARRDRPRDATVSASMLEQAVLNAVQSHSGAENELNSVWGAQPARRRRTALAAGGGAGR